MRAHQRTRSLTHSQATRLNHKMNIDDDFGPYGEMHAESRFAMACVTMMALH